MRFGGGVAAWAVHRVPRAPRVSAVAIVTLERKRRRHLSAAAAIGETEAAALALAHVGHRQEGALRDHPARCAGAAGVAGAAARAVDGEADVRSDPDADVIFRSAVAGEAAAFPRGSAKKCGDGTA